jgi:hypothetical protein
VDDAANVGGRRSERLGWGPAEKEMSEATAKDKKVKERWRRIVCRRTRRG